MGILTEAWGEVRVHRARVVLSLVGVFLAVFAMTIITAAGEMGRTAIKEQAEAQGGRVTTLQLSAYPLSGGFQAWSLLGEWMAGRLLRAERAVEQALGRLAGFRMLVVVEKASTGG